MNDPVSEALARIKVQAAKPRVQKKRYPTGFDGRRLRKREFETIGSVLNKEIKKRGWQPHISREWVKTNWEDIVGPYIARHCEIKMIKDTTLFIQCDSTAKTRELRLIQADILRTIAKKVGSDVVTELKIFPPNTPSWRFGPLHVKGRGPRDTYG